MSFKYLTVIDLLRISLKMGKMIPTLSRAVDRTKTLNIILLQVEGNFNIV
jgi:hypothetical protein